ncbi:TonB-dependent receptor domain-containing protein [Haliscomenobacter sp.]|uniref:TonB-dependent receptor n=1 Tax=Haliscomenobacter sp. TaxID=2717303 RepID=UPI003BAD57E1
MRFSYSLSLSKIVFCAILLLGFLSNLTAQNKPGTIAGKIIDKASGEALIGATVMVEGTDNGTVTDIEGNFTLELNPGTFILVCSYVSYQNEKVQVVAKSGEVTNLNVTMQESVSALEEVVVVATVEKSSALALLTERKNSPQVSDGISADAIRKTPDRTTSDVLKRVTGASIQDGKFAIIRGMNDRYNAGYLDGALLPSTEADRKAFAFDVVPATLLDNLQIIKAGTPDLVGDFGGGVIKINTKSVPTKLTQSISIGAQTHSLTTFKDFFQFKRYSGEGLNFISSKRDIPNFDENGLRSSALFPNNAQKQQFAGISQNFNNDWSNETLSAAPNGRFSYSLGFPIKFSNTRKLGVIFALNYANTRRFSDGIINTFDGSGQVSNFKDQIYQQNISTGGLLNINYVAGKTQINFRNLLNVNQDNNTIRRTGVGNISDNVLVRNFASIINYNGLSNSILSFKRVFGDNDFTVSASVNYSKISRNIPDYRIVNYSNVDPASEPENYYIAPGDFFNTSSGRFFSNLSENVSGATVELAKSLKGKTKIKTELKLGGFIQNRNREFESRNFVYNGISASNTQNPAIDLGPSAIAGDKLYLLEKTSNDLAYYTGKSNLTAVYGMADQKIAEKLRAVYGLRFESIDIDVTNQKVNTDVAKLGQNVWLPSANLSYSLTEKANIRAAYYSSVNRPEFRELAPFAFYVFDRNAEIKGNKDLKIATLNNYDLRLEIYPSGSQVISVGGFYKSIQNPIELSIDITQPFTTFTYQNEKSANIYGLEFEVRKNLDFLDGKGDGGFFHDMVFFSNLALIKSQLTFEEGSNAKQGRPLQGQSPYVINAGLQYENQENGWFASAVLNRVGRRIAFVGVDPQFGDTRQDIYEQPRTVIDVQVGKNIGKLNAKLTAGDLLRKNLVYYQDVDNSKDFNESDRRMFQFTNGSTIALNLSYTF